MLFETYALPAVILVSLTSIVLVVSRDWRVHILALGAQYVGVFSLTALSWPVEMAAAKVVAGWIAGAVLTMALLSLSAEQQGEEDSRSERPIRSAQVFPFLAAMLVGLAVLSFASQLASLLPILSIAQVWGSLILLGMGLLQLGFTVRPFRTTLGLLTALSGFEILYAGIETSVMVAGLLAAVNLGLALVGSYLVLVPQLEEAE